MKQKFKLNPYLELKEAHEMIFSDKDFLDELQKYANDNKLEIDQCKDKAISYFKEIAAKRVENRLFWKFSKFTVKHLIINKFDEIIIDSKKFEKIKNFKDNTVLIFIPNHRSIFDFMILPYIFYTNLEIMPMILSGTVFNVPLLGRIFRDFGTYFVRRGEKDQLYMAVFKYYVYNIIRNEITNLFFIEGTRSRDGKIREPKKGILSYVINAKEKYNITKDIIFIPLNITYDIVPEAEVFAKEAQHGSKANILHSLKKYLYPSKRFGNCYISLGSLIRYSGFKKGADKTNAIDILAEKIIDELTKNNTLTLIQLISYCLKGHETINHDELRKLVEETKNKVDGTIIKIDNIDISKFEYYLRLMKSNGLIGLKLDTIFVKDQAKIDYYSNMISYLFKE